MSKGVSSGKKTKQTANDYNEIFNQFKKDGHFLSIGKVLGKGSFGEVREVLCKNKIMAAKISLENNEKAGEIFSYDLKGRNIIKINKIHMKEVTNCFISVMFIYLVSCQYPCPIHSKKQNTR